jgi:hypothetical protein
MEIITSIAAKKNKFDGKEGIAMFLPVAYCKAIPQTISPIQIMKLSL